MITFYPRDIKMWRKDFDFNPPITCIQHEKDDYKVFQNRDEFIQFLKPYLGERGVNDPEHPLRIESANPQVYCKGHPQQGELFVVVQWSVIGWIRDDYR